MVQCVTSKDEWERPTLRSESTATLISVTKQTMPEKQKKTFLSWVDFAVKTAAKLDPAPRKSRPDVDDFDSEEEFLKALRPYFGKALPREAFDPDSGYKPGQREECLARFLAGLDWKANPFLRSPDEMKRLGFKGTPYKI